MPKISFPHLNCLNCFSSPQPENTDVSQAGSNFDPPEAEDSAKQIIHRQSARQTALLAQLTSDRDAGSVASSSRSAPTPNTGDKAHLIDGFQKIRQHFATLLAENWSPGPMDDHYDRAMLPVFVAMENNRSPNLNLTLLPPSENFGKWLKNWMQDAKHKQHEQAEPASARVMFAMPGFALHHAVADIRRDQKGVVSVLLVEPPGFKGELEDVYEQETLPALKKMLNSKACKGKVTLTIVTLDTQKSDNDCRIFLLSAASKMADEPEFLDRLHAQNLAGEFKTVKGTAPPILADLDRIKVIDGKGIMPISFFKHSQSINVLGEWLRQNPPDFANASVNKSGQSLMQRFKSHRTTRYQKPIDIKVEQMQHPQQPSVLIKSRTSTSIEKKRLTYIDRALDYLSQARELELNAFRRHFDNAIDGVMPDPEKRQLAKRKLGPHPNEISNDAWEK